jgi:hypothetical protein
MLHRLRIPERFPTPDWSIADKWIAKELLRRGMSATQSRGQSEVPPVGDGYLGHPAQDHQHRNYRQIPQRYWGLQNCVMGFPSSKNGATNVPMRTVLLLVTTVLIGQSQDKDLTGGSPNGRFWNSLTFDGRLAYVMGVLDSATAIKVQSQGACISQSSRIVEKMFGKSRRASYGELVAGITLFYKTAANRPIPVLPSLYYVTMKIEGATKEDLDSFELLLRKSAK